MDDAGKDELAVLRRIAGGAVSARELEDLADEYAQHQRIQVALIQHPRFPERRALNLLPNLFAGDLLRVIRNRRTNPLVRRRGEMEFLTKFQRMPVGEKISALRRAPAELLKHFTAVRDSRLLGAILSNPHCTESVILGYLTAGGDHTALYRALDGNPWLHRPAVAAAVSRDPQAPVKVLLGVIPLLKAGDLRRLDRDPGTHRAVRERIRQRPKRG